MTTASTEAFQYLSNSPSSADPVTKAVVDNILGNLPKKKEKVLLYCTICNLDFSSQIPLDMHLQGTKHNKKVRSQEILKSLQEEGSIPEDMDMNSLRCDVCNIMSNSSQQLQMHLKGTKHLNKCKNTSDHGQTTSVALKRPPPSTEGLGEPDAKLASFSCDVCNVQLNSQSQYQQHMDSLKHKNKMSGIKKPKWGTTQYQKRTNFQNSNQNSGSQHNGRKFNPGMPPLSQSFNMNRKNYTNAFGEESGNNMEYEQNDMNYEHGLDYSECGRGRGRGNLRFGGNNMRQESGMSGYQNSAPYWGQ